MDTATLVARRLHEIRAHSMREHIGTDSGRSLSFMWPLSHVALYKADEWSTQLIGHTSDVVPEIRTYKVARESLQHDMDECSFSVYEQGAVLFQKFVFVYKNRYVHPIDLSQFYIRILLRIGWLRRPWTWMA